MQNCAFWKVCQNRSLIVAGTSPLIYIDFGNNEPGMTLQCLDRAIWRDYLVDGEPVLSPVDIEALPPGKYRLV